MKLTMCAKIVWLLKLKQHFFFSFAWGFCNHSTDILFELLSAKQLILNKAFLIIGYFLTKKHQR